MNLLTCIHRFFDLYLCNIKGSRQQTVKAYRDAIRILLPFCARYHGVKIESLTVKHLTFEMILAFLDHLEKTRHNIVRTRNHRLAVIKSLGKMIRLMSPEHKDIAERILSLPQKRGQKPLIGFLHHEEALQVFAAVDLKANQGMRDYTILNLLYDSGARAAEVAALDLDYFDPDNKRLTILGKGNRYRLIELWPKTIQLLNSYINDHRPTPRPLFRQRLFINQRGGELTRYGINAICKKYLTKALPPKRLKNLNPAHSFRHSCAVNMLQSGYAITDIMNHLGHESVQSTMVYLKLELSRKKEIQKEFSDYTRTLLPDKAKIEELIDWSDKEQILSWLDEL